MSIKFLNSALVQSEKLASFYMLLFIHKSVAHLTIHIYPSLNQNLPYKRKQLELLFDAIKKVAKENQLQLHIEHT